MVPSVAEGDCGRLGTVIFLLREDCPFCGVRFDADPSGFSVLGYELRKRGGYVHYQHNCTGTFTMYVPELRRYVFMAMGGDYE